MGANARQRAILREYKHQMAKPTPVDPARPNRHSRRHPNANKPAQSPASCARKAKPAPQLAEAA